MENNTSTTKNHILKIAKNLFARYGLKKTTMDEIARAANLAKGTLYIYFVSKDQLFTEIVKQEAEEYFKILTVQLNQAENAEEKIKAFIKTNFEIIFDYVNLYSIAYTTMSEINDLMPFLKQEIAEYHAKTKELISSILEEGIAAKIFRPVEVEPIVESFNDIVIAIGFPFSPYLLQRNKEVVYKKIDVMLDLILNGLKS